MVEVRFLPDDRVVETRSGWTVLRAALKAGIPHTHACGGNARCTTCRVLVLDGEDQLAGPTWKETRVARNLGFGTSFRLACQAKILGDVTVRRLVIDPEDVAITDARDHPSPIGVETEVAVLFSDIRNFTALAESLLPYDVIHLLNRHYYDMGEVIDRRGGRITSYMGDGLMVLFGGEVSETGGDAARRAVLAGLEMLERQEARRGDLEDLYGSCFEINIGIHTGEAVVGMLGGDVAVVSAIGDVVNTASRIESANKRVGSQLLVSESTFVHVADLVDVGRQVRLELKGKSGSYLLREVLGAKGLDGEG